MLHRDFNLELKTVGAAGTFQGLAAVYGNLDAGGDIIERGAFTETLQKRGHEVPVLWAHDMGNPIALGKLSDSTEGLHIHGELDLETVSGKEALSRMRKGIVRGLSVGYRVPPGGAVTEGDGVRRLKRIDLYEVSLVAVPMNDRARVTSVKSELNTIRDFERWLRDAGGFSRSEAKKLASHGFAGLDQDDEPDPTEAALLAFFAEQKQAAVRRW